MATGALCQGRTPPTRHNPELGIHADPCRGPCWSTASAGCDGILAQIQRGEALRFTRALTKPVNDYETAEVLD